MKVLHVIDTLAAVGGAETSLATLLPYLRDRGVDSSVVSLFGGEGGLVDNVRGEGFEIVALTGSTWPVRVSQLRRTIRSQSPDIVHASLVNSCLVTRVACVGLKVRQLNSLVNTTYDPVRTQMLGIAPWKLTVLKTVDGFTARHLGDRFHAITNAVKEEAITVLGIAPDRVTVVPRGRSADSLSERTPHRRRRIREALGLDGDVPVLLNVGRQDNQKAQAHLIQAFAIVLKSHPDAVLLIAGREGNSTAEIEAALVRLRLTNPLSQDSVRMLGYRTDVPDLLSAADIFVFPSVYEGLGGVLIEAMGMGVPIVGSDAPAISEVLGGGEFGVVIERGRSDLLSGALCELISDDESRRDLSQRASQRYSEKFELGQVADSMVKMYGSMVRETSASESTGS